jgi:hypothetical protein
MDKKFKPTITVMDSLIFTTLPRGELARISKRRLLSRRTLLEVDSHQTG